MSKIFDAADGIILDEYLEMPWSNIDDHNDVSRQVRLALVSEHCFEYFVNGQVDYRLKRLLGDQGIKDYFMEKLHWLMLAVSQGNAVGSPFIKFRASIVSFLSYVHQLRNIACSKNTTFYVDDHTRKHLQDIREKESDSFERGARKNRESIRKLLSSIFDAKSKVLVLRIDLWYDYCAGTMSESSDVPKLNRDSICHIDMHRKDFIKHLRATYSKKLLGYVWRLEYGTSRGYHLHFLILLDGQAHAQDVSHGMALGEYWKMVITSGQGGYYNCNANKNAYQDLAIGMISYDDQAKRDAIEKIARYFTKNDQLFQAINNNESRRTFGRSGLLKPPSNRGRKREKTC